MTTASKEAPRGVPQLHLPVGLLRPLQEPVAALVLDVSVRQPSQGGRISGAAQAGGREVDVGARRVVGRVGIEPTTP